MTNPSGAAAHAGHDLHLIAAAADPSAEAATREAAEQQAAGCVDCHELLADLRVIRTSLAELPRELPVQRDFRITADQAARLRRHTWRDVIAGIRRSTSLRPLASAMTAVGVAGLLVTVALPSMRLGSASTAAPAAAGSANDRTSVLQAAASAAPGGNFGSAPEASGKTGQSGTPGSNAGSGGGSASGPISGAVATAVAAASGDAGSLGEQHSPQALTAGPEQDQAGPIPPAAPAPTFEVASMVPWVSFGLVVIGVGLFILARPRARDSAG